MREPATGHLVLTGPRAVGKTTIGRALSAVLSRPFIDLDARVLSLFDEKNVQEVWDIHGEEAWRLAECRALASVLREPPGVIALGGGVPTIPDAARSLDEARASGQAQVIWLKADPDLLATRLSRETGDRPSLTGLSPAQEIAQICNARAEAYEAISDESLDVENMTIEAIIAAIQAMM